MPTSKKRKQLKRAKANRRSVRADQDRFVAVADALLRAADGFGLLPDHNSGEPVPAYPIWEYQKLAEVIAADDPDLNTGKALAILLAAPIRMWNSTGTQVVGAYPAALAADAGCHIGELFFDLTVMHRTGFVSWDELAQAHYLSRPA